jgi:hypothetical protein
MHIAVGPVVHSYSFLKGVSGRSKFNRADLLLRMLSRLVTEAAFRPSAVPIRTRSLPVAASSSSRLSSSGLHGFVLFLGICAGQKRFRRSTFKRRILRTLPTSFGSCEGNGFSDCSFHEERARGARFTGDLSEPGPRVHASSTTWRLGLDRQGRKYPISVRPPSRGRIWSYPAPRPRMLEACWPSEAAARAITARSSDGLPATCAAPPS